MRIGITILGIILALPLFGQMEKMKTADSLYTAEKYQEAAERYEEILKDGKESPELYFNLGNAYFKTGDINRAILHYERARLLDPNDEDIAFNLQIANQYVVTSIDPLPQPFFVRWSQAVINQQSADSWGRISLLAFFLFLVSLGFFLFGKSFGIKRFSFVLGILLLVVTLLTFSFASKQRSRIQNRNHAIVFCPRVTVKSSPSESGTDLFLIYEGVKVEITDSLDSWKEVKLLDGNLGWLKDSCLVRI